MLLVAPSGFGKTSLLEQWATTTGAQVAWVSCDESCGEPARFWSRLTASLAARWPATGSDAALILERPSWEDPELVDALARDLEDLPAPAAVVIDDAQFAEASQRTLASVARQLPADVRLLVASQHNPVFSTSRLRLAGVITELRADDLAFTQVEVEQLLELAGLGREPVDSRRLRSLTEGWPAGLQMAVLAMRAGGDPREVIDAFAATTQGDQRLPGQRGDEPAASRPGRLPDEHLRPGGVRRRALPGGQRPGRRRRAPGPGGRRRPVHLPGRPRGPAVPAAPDVRGVPAGAAEVPRRHPVPGRAPAGRGGACGSAGTGWQRCITRWRWPTCSWPRTLLADSMHTILDVTHAQEARAVARAWLARFGDAAARSRPRAAAPVRARAGGIGAAGCGGLAHEGEPGPRQPRPGPGRPGARRLGGLLPQPGQHRSRAGAQQAGPPGGQRRGRAGPAVPDARRAAPAGSRSAPAGRRPPGGGRRPPARHPAPERPDRGGVPDTRHPGLGGIPAGRPGHRPARRWTGPPGLPRNTTPWRTGWE